MLFGDKVRMLMDERGLTQKDLVARSGMSQPRVSMLLRNKVTDPRLETIVLMARALDVTVSELIDGVTPRENVEYRLVDIGGDDGAQG